MSVGAFFHWVKTDPSIALVVDECDLATGRVQQVIARWDEFIGG